VIDIYNTRALVKSQDGEQHTFIGCNYYRLKPSCFGLVVGVIGFNGSQEELLGVFFRPLSATVGAMEPGQIEMVRQRRKELEAV